MKPPLRWINGKMVRFSLADLDILRRQRGNNLDSFRYNFPLRDNDNRKYLEKIDFFSRKTASNDKLR